MTRAGCFWALLLVLHTTSATVSTAALKHNLVLYSDISQANTSESLERLRTVPFHTYRFRYDTIPERQHVGILPSDAARYFPETVEVVAKYALGGNGGEVLDNFPVVDKMSLSLHGLAAIQQLIKVYDGLVENTNGQAARTLEEKTRFNQLLSDMEKKFDEARAQHDREHSDFDIEMNKLAKIELDLARSKSLAHKAEAEELQARALAQVEEEKQALAYQQALVKKRFEQENDLAAAAAETMVQALREAEERKKKAAEEVMVKRAALDKELMGKKAALEKEKMRAEMQAKADAERANEDVALRKLELKSRLELVRQKDAIKQVAGHVSRIVKDVVSQPKQVALLLGAVLCFIAAYFAVRELVSVVREFIQSQLGKPSLVRETSRRGGLLSSSFSWLWAQAAQQVVARAFEDVILAPADREQIITLAVGTRNTKRSGAPYRHVLLHGPPGTGKTLVARRLAESSGMDYAIMSGGDVGPLGEDAVSQLHKLFRWASRSSNGLLLFVDEAEAFLGSRQGHTLDQHMRNALNALLYQTGTQSRNFMLVLATNRPEDLDAAVLDRLDVSLRISLPGSDECQQLVKLYMDRSVTKFALGTGGLFKKPCHVDEAVLTSEFLQIVAARVLGFSGREISKFFIALQCEMLLAPGKRLTDDIVLRCLDGKVREHKEKRAYVTTTNTPKSPKGKA